ncbi:ABC transporter permease [Alicyclobacillus shizuokensis]|uniref:ABC transporter permease n=1 Tax=Alicyclobacillus shizuokensis TaxID=392014 RepID=UPI000835768D|nr:ABC transporter permease [Alicyclobacillus shizuokensis]MCL6625105.1 ABC transporter permease [Alicyclobacillus shizuokensis]
MAIEIGRSDSLLQGVRRRSVLHMRWHRFCRNKVAVVGLGVVALLVLLAILAPVLSPYSYFKSDFTATYQAPSVRHWLGTDSLGRDVFSRVLWGLRSACIVGFGAEVVELTLGLLLGAIAGYMGGVVDNVLMRIVDIVYAFPSFLFSIILVVLLGHNIWAVLIAVSATSWVGMARVVRSQVLAIRQSGYIESARSLGAGWWRAIRRYVIPNALGPILVAVTFGIPANMMTEAGLSVVGLGIEPPTPDLGQMIIEGQSSLFSYPYLLLAPALVFAVALLAFTFVGDGLRDAFDTKQRR